ncbi:MAG: hypothetical protein GEU80_15285 [Dehalococcoidia bacterium]|nr:hypothetical protein [Dehalococcoidia bacterium]
MRVKCGWAEFLAPDGAAVVARGRVSVSNAQIPAPTWGPWEADVWLLRGYESLRGGEGDLWLLRFEDGNEYRWVALESLVRQWAPSGLRAAARVVSYDHEYPSVLTELGGDF